MPNDMSYVRVRSALAFVIGVLPFLGGSSSNVLKLDHLTKQEYSKLPGSAVISVEGRTTSKKQIIEGAMRRRAVELLRLESESNSRASQLILDRTREVGRAQSEAFDEWNILARSRYSMETDPQKLRVIQKEAQDLARRASRGAPEELKKIEARAGELLDQVRQTR
jgi:hypothetical protein